MQIPLQITARDMEMTPSLEQRVREKVKKLESFYNRILGCRVLIESPHRSNHKGNHYNVRIRLTIPGGELVVKREPSESLQVAIRDTFDAARRQLLSYAGKQRSSIKDDSIKQPLEVTQAADVHYEQDVANEHDHDVIYRQKSAVS